MSKLMIRFFLGLVPLVFVLIPFNYYLIEALLGQQFNAYFYGLYIYFSVLIGLIQFKLVKLLYDRPQKFVIGFMAALGIKMFLSLAILAILIYTKAVDQKIFGVNFATLYLVFTGFSISQLWHAQRTVEALNK